MDFHIQTSDGNKHSVGFPGNMPVQTLLTEFILDENVKIHPREVVAWDLEDEPSGHRLDLKKSLEQHGAKNGHVLRLLREAELAQQPRPPPSRPGTGPTPSDSAPSSDASKDKTCHHAVSQ